MAETFLYEQRFLFFFSFCPALNNELKQSRADGPHDAPHVSIAA